MNVFCSKKGFELFSKCQKPGKGDYGRCGPFERIFSLLNALKRLSKICIIWISLSQIWQPGSDCDPMMFFQRGQRGQTTRGYSFFFCCDSATFGRQIFSRLGDKFGRRRRPIWEHRRREKRQISGRRRRPIAPKRQILKRRRRSPPKETSLKGIYVLRDTLKVRILP